MDPHTPTSEGGDQSNALRGQPVQSFQTANTIVDGNPAADSDRCFKCHELGHLVKLLAIARDQYSAAQDGVPGAYISQPTMYPQTPTSGGGDNLKARRDKCFECHELGHWLKYCPSVNARVQCNAVQAGDPDAYISQRTMDPQTPISEGGDHASILRGQPWQPVQPGNPFGNGSPAAKSDRCFRCHELGHWKKDCPSANARVQCNATQAGCLGAYNSQPKIDPETTTSEGDYTDALSGRERECLKHANPIVDGNRAAHSDKCFRCHELGHWAKDCPSANVKTQCNPSQGGDPGAYTIPEKFCPCGGGLCLILTSKTKANPGKKFYKCPVKAVGGQCRFNFFQWCDAPVSSSRHNSTGGVGGFRGQSATPTQIYPVAPGAGLRGQSATPIQNSPVAEGAEEFRGHYSTPTQNSPEAGGFRGQSPTLTQSSAGGGGLRRQSTTPGNNNKVGIVRGYDYSTRCPCGAGPCPVRTARTERNMGRQFVTCPVRQGEGSCRFFKWCDELDSPNMPVTTSDFTPKHDSGSSGRKGASPCFKCGVEGHWKKDCPQL